MLFKLSNLNSNLALTLGYLNQLRTTRPRKTSSDNRGPDNRGSIVLSIYSLSSKGSSLVAATYKLEFFRLLSATAKVVYLTAMIFIFNTGVYDD